jgi:hypothetical protein
MTNAIDVSAIKSILFTFTVRQIHAGSMVRHESGLRLMYVIPYPDLPPDLKYNVSVTIIPQI